MSELQSLLDGITAGDVKSLARAITWVENELPGYETLLKSLQPSRQVPVVGFTGPPGAGKSTLINALVGMLSAQNKRIAVVAVDPTSPFNYGSLLADRLRMSERFTDPHIFIRSVATRGSLGGLSDKMIEITEVLKAAPFDLVLVETVGVGQSEVEIAGLADTTVVVVVPESGDDIQALKSGIMEIADIFVVNKGDREGADRMVNNLQKISSFHPGDPRSKPVIKTSALQSEGLQQLMEAITGISGDEARGDKRAILLAEKLYRIIRRKRMDDVKKKELLEKIKETITTTGSANIYRMAEDFLSRQAS